MCAIVACRAVVIVAGLAVGAGIRARTLWELDRPVLLLGCASVVGSISAASIEGGWGLPLVATLGVLGYVLTLGVPGAEPPDESSKPFGSPLEDEGT
ncbi:hypothetical protein JXA88_06485 [Candidatus Fermentibacteria bacterium]|nr:hypothetical protein [Candidatus Fermentibacteria bacterium]